MSAPGDWVELAACANHPEPRLWFPEVGVPGAALRLCHSCPVKEECLEYALVEKIPHGIFGGVGVDARKKMLAKRRAGVA